MDRISELPDVTVSRGTIRSRKAARSPAGKMLARSVVNQRKGLRSVKQYLSA